MIARRRARAWRRLCLATALAAGIIAGQAFAQEPGGAGAQARAAELLQVMNAEQLVTQMSQLGFRSSTEAVRARVAQAQCPAAQRVFDDFSAQAEEAMRKAFVEGDYLGEMAKLYAETFTEAELQDVIDFYRSPTGRKFLERQPALLQRGAALGQSLVQARMPEFNALGQRMGAELEQALAACPAAGAGGQPPQP